MEEEEGDEEEEKNKLENKMKEEEEEEEEEEEMRGGRKRRVKQNESFNGRLRDECLNGEVFHTLKEAQVIIAMHLSFCSCILYQDGILVLLSNGLLK